MQCLFLLRSTHLWVEHEDLCTPFPFLAFLPGTSMSEMMATTPLCNVSWTIFTDNLLRLWRCHRLATPRNSCLRYLQAGWESSHLPLFGSLTKGRHFPPLTPLQQENMQGDLADCVERFGKNTLLLWKALLAGMRVLIVSEAPAGVHCQRSMLLVARIACLLDPVCTSTPISLHISIHTLFPHFSPFFSHSWSSRVRL